MGTGKSVVGKLLAKDISFRFVDTDRLVEEKAGKKIADIFAEQGEKLFRELEAEVVRSVMSEGGLVVSTGGGAVMNQDNLNLFCQNGIVVWLTSRPEVILKRTQRRIGNRPLLKGNDPLLKIKQLMGERASYYNRAALSVDTSDISVDSVVSLIKENIFGLHGRDGAAHNLVVS